MPISTIGTNGLGSSLTLATPTLTSPIITGSNPQVTVYTSGSGTYTTPANCRYLYVKMVGGGGGGGGGAAGGNSSVGGTTTFGTSLLTCTGGQGLSTSSSAGGATLNSPAFGIANTGNRGGGFNAQLNANSVYGIGGTGGASPFGACGNANANDNGSSAGANSGSGGGGGSNNAGANLYAGGGGGSGGYIEAYITSPSATYSYAVGTGGTGGTAGTGGNAGGNGGSGVIYVFAFF